MITITVVLILIILQGFFSGIETGFISLDRIRFKVGKVRETKSGKIIDSYIKHPDRFLTTTLVGTNIANILAATLFTTYLLRKFPDSGDIISSLILIPVVLMFAEIIPKSIFLEHSYLLTIKTIFILKFFHIVFYLPISVLSWISGLIVSGISRKKRKKNPFLTKDELILLTERGKTAHDKFMYETTKKIFIFGAKRIADIMIKPWNVIGIDNRWDLRRIKQEFINSRANYLPVFERNKCNILGILQAKKLLYLNDKKDLKDVLIKVESIDYDTSLETGIAKFQIMGLPLMTVTFKKRVVGIVMLRDIIKQLF